jgi:uncharacterized membrane protein
MDLHPLYQRKYSASHLLSLAWRVYKANFWTIFAVTLIIQLPLNLVSFIALYYLPITKIIGYSGEEPFINWDVVYLLMPILLAIVLLMILFGILMELAISFIAKSSIEGRKLSYRKTLGSALRKWPAGIYAQLIMYIMLLPLFLLFLVPGVVYAIYWFFTSYAVMLSGKTGKAALDHSKKLVKGRFWKVFGNALFFMFFVIIAIVTISLFQAFSPKNILTELFYAVLTSMAGAFFIMAMSMLYLNLEATEIPQNKAP